MSHPRDEAYLSANADVHTRMCHRPGCANYVGDDNPTRWHCSEACAAFCLNNRRLVDVRLTHDDPQPDEEPEHAADDEP